MSGRLNGWLCRAGKAVRERFEPVPDPDAEQNPSPLPERYLQQHPTGGARRAWPGHTQTTPRPRPPGRPEKLPPAQGHARVPASPGRSGGTPTGPGRVAAGGGNDGAHRRQSAPHSPDNGSNGSGSGKAEAAGTASGADETAGRGAGEGADGARQGRLAKVVALADWRAGQVALRDRAPIRRERRHVLTDVTEGGWEEAEGEPGWPAPEGDGTKKRLAWRGGRVPRGRAGSAPVRIARPAGFFTSRRYQGRRGVHPLVLAVLFVWRFTTGKELRGQPRTDAGPWQQGWHCFGMGQRPPHPWFFLPLAHRAGLRVAGLAALVGAVYCWWRWPATTPQVAAWGLLVTAMAAAGLGCWAATQALLLWPHRNRWVNPTAHLVGDELGYPFHTPARRWLHIPPDVFSAGATVTCVLPRDFHPDGERQAKVVALFRTALPLQAVKPHWELYGKRHRLELTNVRKTIPASIKAGPHIQAIIDSLPVTRPLCALDYQGKPLGPDFNSESPHMMIHAESGGGKTSLQRLLGAQFYRDGARVVIVDPKRFSHGWAFNLPGVDYWRSKEQVHTGMNALIAELDRRNRIAEEAILAGHPEPAFTPLVVLFDEANMAIDEQKDLWRAIREPGDRPTPPAVRALKLLLQAGRQVRIRVVLVTQHGGMNELGGPAIRVAFGCIVFLRAGRKAYRMLADDISPHPPKSYISGRVQILLGSTLTEGQVPFYTNAEAEALALTPRPDDLDETPVEAAMSPVTHTRALQDKQGGDNPNVTTPGDNGHSDDSDHNNDGTDNGGDGTGSGGGEGADVVLVSLHQASVDKGDGLVPIRHSTLKRARARARKGEGRPFPHPVAKAGDTELFDLDQLRAFAAGTYQPADQEVPTP